MRIPEAETDGGRHRGVVEPPRTPALRRPSDRDQHPEHVEARSLAVDADELLQPDSAHDRLPAGVPACRRVSRLCPYEARSAIPAQRGTRRLQRDAGSALRASEGRHLPLILHCHGRAPSDLRSAGRTERRTRCQRPVAVVARGLDGRGRGRRWRWQARAARAAEHRSRRTLGLALFAARRRRRGGLLRHRRRDHAAAVPAEQGLRRVAAVAGGARHSPWCGPPGRRRLAPHASRELVDKISAVLLDRRPGGTPYAGNTNLNVTSVSRGFRPDG